MSILSGHRITCDYCATCNAAMHMNEGLKISIDNVLYIPGLEGGGTLRGLVSSSVKKHHNYTVHIIKQDLSLN